MKGLPSLGACASRAAALCRWPRGVERSSRKRQSIGNGIKEEESRMLRRKARLGGHATEKGENRNRTRKENGRRLAAPEWYTPAAPSITQHLLLVHRHGRGNAPTLALMYRATRASHPRLIVRRARPSTGLRPIPLATRRAPSSASSECILYPTMPVAYSCTAHVQRIRKVYCPA